MEGSFLGSLREAESPKVPLADKPGVNNWVEKYHALGGPRNWIKRTAEHLKGKGKADGHAIAIAVNAARKMCASGDTNFPGVQQVNAGSKAEACAAVAIWDKAKAQARTMRVAESELRAYETAGVWIRRTAERLLELGAEPEAALDAAVGLCEVYVPGSFVPGEHPRGPGGEWIKKGAFGFHGKSLVKVTDPEPGKAGEVASHHVGAIGVKAPVGSMRIAPSKLKPAGEVKVKKVASAPGATPSEKKRLQVHHNGKHVGDIVRVERLAEAPSKSKISQGKVSVKHWSAVKPGEAPSLYSGHSTQHEAMDRLVNPGEKDEPSDAAKRFGSGPIGMEQLRAGNRMGAVATQPSSDKVHNPSMEKRWRASAEKKTGEDKALDIFRAEQFAHSPGGSKDAGLTSSEAQREKRLAHHIWNTGRSEAEAIAWMVQRGFLPPNYKSKGAARKMLLAAGKKPK